MGRLPSFVMPDGMINLLSQIKDGMGNTTTVNYKYLSDASVLKEEPMMSIRCHR